MLSRSADFRNNAQFCRDLADKEKNSPKAERYGRMAKAWESLAFEEDWLLGLTALPPELEEGVLAPLPTSDPVPVRRHAAEVLKRARRTPIGALRNDLRQLAKGLLQLSGKS